MSGIVDASGSECGEGMADVEAWRPNDPILGGSVEKVWSPSGSLAHVTETVTAILRRGHWRREATATRCPWNPLPGHF